MLIGNEDYENEADRKGLHLDLNRGRLGKYGKHLCAREMHELSIFFWGGG